MQVCDLHMALKIQYVYYYITEVIQNNKNTDICNTGQGES
jgi:hypothetical protein